MLTYFPSITLFSLTLGPDSPSVDEPCGGNLRVSEHWILTNVFATQSDILTSISSISAFANTSTYHGTLPYRYTFLNKKFYFFVCFVYLTASANFLVP